MERCTQPPHGSFVAQKGFGDEHLLHSLFHNPSLSCELVDLHLVDVDLTPFWQKLSQCQALRVLTIQDAFYHSIQLHSIAELIHLQTLVIVSDALISVTPLQTLTNLRSLTLNCAALTDSDILSLIQHMPHLQHLDICDTAATPFIVNLLPHTLCSIAGGDRVGYTSQMESVPLPPDSVRQACLLPRYEMQTIDFRQLVPFPSFPQLQALEWGHWRTCPQSIDPLIQHLPQLDSLCLFGPDYGDDMVVALQYAVNIQRLELHACSITDITCWAIGRHPRVRQVTLNNCKRVTPRGFYALCEDGMKRCLESVCLFGEPQSPREAMDAVCVRHRDMMDIEVEVAPQGSR